MNTITRSFNSTTNVGTIDRSARYLVGGALIGVYLLVPAFVGWMALLPLLAIPLIISAIIGWDPLYALFQKLPIPRMSPTRVEPVTAAAAA